MSLRFESLKVLRVVEKAPPPPPHHAAVFLTFLNAIPVGGMAETELAKKDVPNLMRCAGRHGYTIQTRRTEKGTLEVYRIK